MGFFLLPLCPLTHNRATLRTPAGYKGADSRDVTPQNGVRRKRTMTSREGRQLEGGHQVMECPQLVSLVTYSTISDAYWRMIALCASRGAPCKAAISSRSRGVMMMR